MASFSVINISLGKLKAGVQQNITYPYTGVKKITKMNSPCDCSVPINKGGSILVRYIPRQVPVHLIQAGATEQAIKKVITIEYIDSDTDKTETILLSFNAVIHN